MLLTQVSICHAVELTTGWHENSLFCRSEWLILFGAFWSSQAQGQTGISQKHLESNNFRSSLWLFFCYGAPKVLPMLWFLKSKQPISHFCQYLPALQYRQTELLSLQFRWSPTIPTSLYRNKIAFAPKKKLFWVVWNNKNQDGRERKDCENTHLSFS